MPRSLVPPSDGDVMRRAGLPRAIVTGVAPAFVVLLALATAVGELGAAVGWRPLASPAASRLVLGVLVVLVGLGSWLAHRATQSGRPRDHHDGPVSWLASAPGLLMVGYAVAALALPLSRRVAWFLGGDHVRHLTFTVQEAVTGNLDYSVNAYPRAWHTLVALGWTSLGGRQDADGLLSIVRLLSAGSWLMYALLALATGHLARDLGARCGLSPAAAARAGLVAGAATLWPSFLSDYMVLGFENSVLAGVVIAVCAREVLLGGRLRGVVVCASGVAVMANTWQVLLPATLVALAVVTVDGWRGGGARARALVVAAVAGAVLVAVPGVVSVVSDVGIGHATDAGVEAPLPVVVLPLSLAAVCLVGWWFRRDWKVLALTAMAVGTALTAPVLALAVGIPVTQYYPSKVLWSAVVLGLAPLGVVISHLGGVLWRLHGPAALLVRSAAGTAAVLLLAGCAVNPAFAVISWPNVDGSRVLATVTSPSAGRAQVVWLPEQVNDSTISRILLDFYRVGSAPFLPQEPLSVARECELLRTEADPTVLSSASASQVQARYACVPGVTAVPIRSELP